MNYKLKSIRLDKLNIPAETLRKSSFPANDEKLKQSIREHGIIVPIIVAELGKDEFAVWDGTRRVKALKEMGKAGSVTVPALITTGTDSDSVVAQININQNRERLNSFAEVEALRQLIQDHNMNQREACKVLLKSESWASKVMKIYGLPENILDDFSSGDIILSQIIVLTKYIDNAKILNFLHREALKGTSAENLKALAIKSESLNAKELNFYKPKLYKTDKKSWIRVKPLQKGVNFNIHLEQTDNPENIIKELQSIIDRLNLD